MDHTPFPGFGPTREDVKRLFAVLRGVLPDLRAEVLDQIADGGRVVTRKDLHGTHPGDLMGLPPSESGTARLRTTGMWSESPIFSANCNPARAEVRW